jgi:glutamate racemase
VQHAGWSDILQKFICHTPAIAESDNTMIGVFDSGVGGLSVWRELAPLLPATPLLYLADQAYVPYGPRSLDAVHALTRRCVRWLIAQGCSTVVIACNTASGAALDDCRTRFPGIHFVGAEPAIKPAALHSRNGVVGVLATHTTFASARYSSLLQRFARGARVLEQASPEWVLLVEHAQHEHDLDDPVIDHHVQNLLAADADVLVLGCTHFSFLRGAIERSIRVWCTAQSRDADIAIIDPAPAIARQALLRHTHAAAPSDAAHGPLRRYVTTGDADRFTALTSLLLKITIAAEHIDLP